MTVGRLHHGVIVAAPGCQGRPSTSPCAVLPLPLPDRWRRPEKQRRVYRRPPESDGGAGAMGPYPDKGGACGSGTCRVRPGGRALTPHAGP
jgi:hypothetical protein